MFVTFLYPITKKDVSTYMEWGKKFTLLIPYELVVFTTDEIEIMVKTFRESLGFKTYFVRLSSFEKKNYIDVVNFKFDVFLETMRKFADHERFIYIDFGIYKRGMTSDDFSVIDKLNRQSNNPSKSVSFAIIDPYKKLRNYDGFLWIAAAGLITFDNDKNSVCFFKECKKMHEKYPSALEETIMWLLWKKNIFSIHPFYANYNTLFLKYYGDWDVKNAKDQRKTGNHR